MTYFFERKQFVKGDIENIWDFFSKPDNLKIITPEKLNFQIIKRTGGKQAYTGQIIAYKVTIPPGIRMTWVTEITGVEENKFFVDEQRVGPYTLWHHQHHFTVVDDGVEVVDIVTYKLPFGIFGILAKGYVNKKLNEIFDFRSKTIEKVFS